ncbi:GDSL esterase/lipase [Capsicum chinense]|nr:GDSL esterase/lipase [Capsicum chinense]
MDAANQYQEEQLFVTTCFAGKSTSENRLINSGCTNHMTSDQKLFKELDRFVISKVKIGNREYLNAKVKETTAIQSPTCLKLITDVFFIPNLDQNLLSVGQLLENDFKVLFEEKACVIKDSDNKEMFKIKMRGRIFYLILLDEEQATVVRLENDSELWHKRLGHYHHAILFIKENQLVEGLPSLEKNLLACKASMGRKQGFSFQNSSWREKNKFQLIHTDVGRPQKKPSLNGNDMRSTSGYYFSFDFGIFSWFSKKQDVVDQSTAEAKYIAVALAVNQALWIRKLLADLYMEQKKSTEILRDNEATISIVNNHVSHGKTKHFKIKLYFLRKQEPQVPCFYIFGDSLVDNGNNNGILTLARANYMPYGVDFPQGTTGRFTNGRTYVDILAQLLGFPNYIPPYARVRGRALLRGANYASGAAGIRDETGNNLGDHMPLNQQVENFGRTVEVLRRLFRGNNYTLNAYLSKCIFYSGLGSNDYLNNYFMTDFYSTHSQYTPQAYANALLQDYCKQLSELYNLGARKVIVTAVGQIGCIPYQLARYDGNSSRCNEEINDTILLFNLGLKKLVIRFNKVLQGAKFVFLDSFESSKDLVVNAKTYGFEVVDKGCCGVGRNNGQITCLPLQQPCEDRSKYIFWDAFHPTEVANILLAKKSYYSKSKAFAYPINIQQLVAV